MRLFLATGLSVALIASAAAAVAAPTADPALPGESADQQVDGGPLGRPAVSLSMLGSYQTGVFDASAAEITAYDPLNHQIFVANADSGALDVLDNTDPSEPTLIRNLSAAGAEASEGSVVPEGSGVNSVVVHEDWTALAVEPPDKTDPGWALFYRTDGTYLGGVRVGPLPDMITVTPDGSRVLTANEGEPDEEFTVDPEGSVSVIDLPAGDPSQVTQADVATARFTAYDNGTPLPEGVRVFGPDVPVPPGHEPAGRVARNLEPEYVVVDATSTTAYVALQEANAIGVVDIASAEVTDIWPIPLKDWSAPGNVFDASDRDDAINLQNWPVYGIAQPDGIGIYEADGESYIVTVNEGDAREWGDYVESVRIGSDAYPLCEDVFGGPEGVAELTAPENLGRQNASIADGLREGEDCYEKIHVFGGRSISILSTDGELVYDSGALIEQTIADKVASGELPEIAFNANHSENPSFDGRSDDKGPEPEDVAIGQVGNSTFAFVGLERIGGVFTFDVTDPTDVRYVDYINNRDFSVDYDEDNPPAPGEAGDLGAEGVAFVSEADSLTGRPQVIVGNEVSGSTTVFDVDVTGLDRVDGQDRYETAATAALQFTPRTVDVVYVATGDEFPDAQVAGAVAAAAGAPVLLTGTDRLPEATAEAIAYLDPERIVVAGGPDAVSGEVVTQLSEFGEVTRVYGPERYSTAAGLAVEGADNPEVVYLATGPSFADGLVGSAAAGADDGPVLLTQPDRLPAATSEALTLLEPQRVVLLGGTAAISAQVEAEVAGQVGEVTRIGGADRYATAAELSASSAAGADLVFLATGEDYPDALAAAAIAGDREIPVLLTRNAGVPAATSAELERLQPRRIVVFGGDAAVSADQDADLADLLQTSTTTP